MTTTDDVVPIRISGPAGLLATVPSILGFHPTKSLVLLCLSGDRRRVGPVARVDLPNGHDRAMAAHLTGHALRHADEVVVVSYQDSRRRPPLLDDLLTELARAGVDVLDAIVVRGGRARPALSAAMERSHPGIPLPDANDPTVRALSAAGALAGRSVLADRAELRKSIAGPTGERLRRADHGIDEAAAGRTPVGNRNPAPGRGRGPRPDGQPPAPDGRPTGRSDPPEHVLQPGRVPDPVSALVERAFTQVVTSGQVAVEVATALAVELTDVLIRDAILVRAMAEVDRPWLPALIACATWIPDPMAPPLCSVLAMVAYRHGDGALAQVAVDRCLAAEPGHRLARTMIAIMAAGIRPDELERIASAAGSGQLSELDPDQPDEQWP
ncbi:MAG TPA: DUF4192 domain-containing protein [Nakamurella sp.]